MTELKKWKRNLLEEIYMLAKSADDFAEEADIILKSRKSIQRKNKYINDLEK